MLIWTHSCVFESRVVGVFLWPTLPYVLPGSADRLDLSLSRDVRDFSYSREVTSRVMSSATASAAKGSYLGSAEVGGLGPTSCEGVDSPAAN